MEREVINVGRQNSIGDDLVVFNGRSDWGDAGWFVGERVNAPGREPFLTPKVFFPGDSREEALASARTDEFWGYASVEA